MHNFTELSESNSARSVFISKLFGLWKAGHRVPEPCILEEGSLEPLGLAS